MDYKIREKKWSGISFELFLLENQFIDYSSRLIAEKAKELFLSTCSDFNKAKKAYNYVRNTIHHSFDIQAENDLTPEDNS
jgi:membrane-bound lytic murein transglycosylase MltF